MATATSELSRAAHVFHALSDETRLQLLELLSRGEQCVCNLTEALDAGQSRLSFHLRTLKDAGLVTDRREGRWVYYTMRDEALEEAGRALSALATRAPRALRGLKCCG